MHTHSKGVRPAAVTFTAGLALAVISAVAPSAFAAPSDVLGSFQLRDCVEVSAIVSVLPERAAAALPDGYTSSSFIGLPGGPGIPGNSSLLMGVETCQSGIIDGVPVDGPVAFGERVLSVDRKDARPGYHFYAVEQVTDNQQIYDLMREAGFDIALVPGVGATADAVGGISEGSSVRIVDEAPVPRVPSPLGQVSIWKDTENSRSALRLTVHRPTAQAGIGHVTAEPNSPIAFLMGTETATGIGAINRFDFDARVEVVR
ncbi:hypothetical protein HQ312_18105 [Rhodococcus sp. BP-316]|uniref:hypothetical protein n=1 Tax=Rhodococcus sp. BP-316 TaxID=2739445 RepID=UPI001C9B80B9|nr:hypothetical protein [Rhodococcus sp. BP-316]MBY6682972.1 hypothetical protein [Rhodococcus sp. BP-316]